MFVFSYESAPLPSETVISTFLDGWRANYSEDRRDSFVMLLTVFVSSVNAGIDVIRTGVAPHNGSRKMVELVVVNDQTRSRPSASGAAPTRGSSSSLASFTGPRGLIDLDAILVNEYPPGFGGPFVFRAFLSRAKFRCQTVSPSSLIIDFPILEILLKELWEGGAADLMEMLPTAPQMVFKL
jgi:hypothetical protein